jgi:hypothetical protein
MCAAFRAAGEVVSGFLARYPNCFPPVIINISDGAATDGNIGAEGLAISRLASTDGNVLLFDIHISARGEKPILFPNSDADLPDENARRLFAISSCLPPPMLRQAGSLQASLADGARGFAFNADLTAVIMFLDIGTRVGGIFGL